jgi:hypothetical protein
LSFDEEAAGPAPDQILAKRLRIAALRIGVTAMWWVPGVVGSWISTDWLLVRVFWLAVFALLLGTYGYATMHVLRLAQAAATTSAADVCEELDRRFARVPHWHRHFGFAFVAIGLLSVLGALLKHKAGIPGEIEKSWASGLAPISIGIAHLWFHDTRDMIRRAAAR